MFACKLTGLDLPGLLRNPALRAPDASIKLYFGYGSNLDRDDWTRFCRDRGLCADVLRPVCAATLHGETLVFDYHSNTRRCGALNLRPRAGSIVDGYLFAVSHEGWAVLDIKEGAPHRYRRERVAVVDEFGQKIEAWTYRVVEEMRQQFVAPNAAYLAACRSGRARYGLSVEQLERAATNGV